MEAIPQSFPFPSQADYVRGLAKGITSVDPLLVAKGTAAKLIEPVKLQVLGVKGAIESATGVKVGQIATFGGDIVALVGSHGVANTIGAVRSLMGSTMGIASTIAKTAGASAGALEAIPFIGQAIGYVMMAIEVGASWDPKLFREQCEQRAKQAAVGSCQKAIAAGTPVATGAKGQVTPADIFRPFAYYAYGAFQVQEWNKLPSGPRPIYRNPPASMGTMFAILCGDALPPYLRWGKNFGGYIPASIQAQMWALIESLMSSMVSPALGASYVRTDDGYSLFPVLQNLVWTEFNRGNLTVAHLKDASDEIASMIYGPTVDCTDIWAPTGGVPAIHPKKYANCEGIIDLASPMYDSLKAFERQVFSSAVYNSVTKTWSFANSNTARVITSSAHLNTVAVRQTFQPVQPERIGTAGKVALATGAGALTFYGITQFLKG